MSRHAYIHVSGVTYELADPVEPDTMAHRDLLAHVEKLAEGSGYGFTQDVRIDGHRLAMHFTSHGVFSAGFYLGAEQRAATGFRPLEDAPGS